MDLTSLSPDLLTQRAQWKKPDVKEAAQQFEALLISEWLKSAREAGQVLSEKSDMTGYDNYQEMAEKHLAETLARKGTFGLARMMLQELDRGADKR